MTASMLNCMEVLFKGSAWVINEYWLLNLQVIVRDFVSKTIVAQFRAHSSPLSALAFDPSGTLLVTASVYGHNLNVFRLTPPSTAGANTAGLDVNTSHVHLYKLYRGVTNAVSTVVFMLSPSRSVMLSFLQHKIV
jgi:WD40 repeat protein